MQNETLTEAGATSSGHDKVNSPLKWYGGKAYLASWIVSQMPQHTHYVETHAGSLAVLFAKNPDGVSEVVNDRHGELTNFYRVLQELAPFAEFQRRVEATPFSQAEFRDAAELEPGADPVERAVKFFIRCRQSRQGNMKDFATLSQNRTRRGMNEQVSAWLSTVDGLPEVHTRLKRVVILNDDALVVIRREDSPSTLFYVDPPYMHDTRETTGDYLYEMGYDDHKHLLEVLAGIEGKFILSGYRHDLYDRFAVQHGWRRVDQEIDCKSSSAKTKPKRTESLWMNYPLAPLPRLVQSSLHGSTLF